MDRGAIHKSLVGEMGEGHGWWSMNNLRPTFQQQNSSPLLPFISTSSAAPSSPSPPFSFSSLLCSEYPVQATSSHTVSSWHENQSLPVSWSQLLHGGLVGEERQNFNPRQAKQIDNWEGQAMAVYPTANAQAEGDKQETYESSGYMYSSTSQGSGHEEIQVPKLNPWNQTLQASSPRSCLTSSFNTNIMEFSTNSSECISTTSGPAFKKARIEGSSSTQSSTVKVVRKEKIGDRITALHQLVSPFGKTDTASVLLEAIGYIRFLHGQIEALSFHYLSNGGGGDTSGPGNNYCIQQQPAEGEVNCISPDKDHDQFHGQLLTDKAMKKRKQPEQGGAEEPKKDLRSRGLCLVPVSCTLGAVSDSVADYWPPAFGIGFGR